MPAKPHRREQAAPTAGRKQNGVPTRVVDTPSSARRRHDRRQRSRLTRSGSRRSADASGAGRLGHRMWAINHRHDPPFLGVPHRPIPQSVVDYLARGGGGPETLEGSVPGASPGRVVTGGAQRPPAPYRTGAQTRGTRPDPAGLLPSKPLIDAELQLDLVRSHGARVPGRIPDQVETIFLKNLPEIPLWYNGAWAQYNTTYWHDYPVSTSPTDRYTPVVWGGWLGNMTTVLGLAQIMPVVAAK